MRHEKLCMISIIALMAGLLLLTACAKQTLPAEGKEAKQTAAQQQVVIEDEQETRPSAAEKQETLPEETQAAPAQQQAQVLPPSGGNIVEIKSFSFNPPTITIKKGESVQWTNRDSVAHTATADDKSFDTSLLRKSESGEILFDKAGTFTYHCSPHPNMKGMVVVEQTALYY